MKIRIPRKKVQEQFLLTYELKGCQKAVDFLTEYYEVKRMKVILNGKRVGNGDLACYSENKAYFTKKGLNKRTVLHELYHHLVYTNGLELSETTEEKNANIYAGEFLRKF
jgi:hypothetical protein